MTVLIRTLICSLLHRRTSQVLHCRHFSTENYFDFARPACRVFRCADRASAQPWLPPSPSPTQNRHANSPMRRCRSTGHMTNPQREAHRRRPQSHPGRQLAAPFPKNLVCRQWYLLGHARRGANFCNTIATRYEFRILVLVSVQTPPKASLVSITGGAAIADSLEGPARF